MTEKFPKPFEFLNDQTDEYVEWFVWAFEKKYGKGSWETLAEKRKHQSKDSNENPTMESKGKGGEDEWRKG
jgi:hypothetical protein